MQTPRELMSAIGTRCPYCNHVMETNRHKPTRDHIHPKSRGGSFATPGNKVIACEPCNTDKGSLSLRQFLAKLQDSQDRRALYVAAFMARHSALYPASKANDCRKAFEGIDHG